MARFHGAALGRAALAGAGRAAGRRPAPGQIRTDGPARRRAAAPYETQATLARLADDLHATAPRRLIALGDSFDDDAAETALPPDMRAMLAMTARHETLWITGNHDPGARGWQSLRWTA